MSAVPARSDTDAVAALIAEGARLHDIATETAWMKGAIVRLARVTGYTLNASSDRFARTSPPTPVPKPVTRIGTDLNLVPVANAHPHEMVTRPPASPDLIATGKASPVYRVQRLAMKAEVALETLAEALRLVAQSDAERDAALAAATRRAARITELEAMLAAEKVAFRARPIRARTRPAAQGSGTAS